MGGKSASSSHLQLLDVRPCSGYLVSWAYHSEAKLPLTQNCSGGCASWRTLLVEGDIHYLTGEVFICWFMKSTFDRGSASGLNGIVVLPRSVLLYLSDSSGLIGACALCMPIWRSFRELASGISRTIFGRSSIMWAAATTPYDRRQGDLCFCTNLCAEWTVMGLISRP